MFSVPPFFWPWSMATFAPPPLLDDDVPPELPLEPLLLLVPVLPLLPLLLLLPPQAATANAATTARDTRADLGLNSLIFGLSSSSWDVDEITWCYGDRGRLEDRRPRG